MADAAAGIINAPKMHNEIRIISQSWVKKPPRSFKDLERAPEVCSLRFVTIFWYVKDSSFSEK